MAMAEGVSARAAAVAILGATLGEGQMLDEAAAEGAAVTEAISALEISMFNLSKSL